jgi:UDP-2,4-diacetamido-2,4,6-trideoxy-beta-L-altropyranose hydrolase
MNTFANRVTVFIRADGNALIGYGHLMRAMAFATHANALTDVVLIIRNPDVYAFEASDKYSLKCVDISDVALENEADYIAELIPSRSILFVDGYQFDEHYLRGVSSKGAFLICMDDHHDRFFPSGCVINIAELEDPKKIQRSAGTKLVYGLNYALIRPEFAPLGIPRKSAAFICFGGGSETETLIKKSVAALVNSSCVFETIQIVVNTQLKTDLNQWLNIHFPSQKTELYSQIGPEEMNHLMNAAQLGICSTSTVALECRTSGLPIIAGFYVENQKGFYRSLIKNGEITGAGDLHLITETELSKLIQQLVVSENNAKKELGVLSPTQISHHYKRLLESCFTELDFHLRKANEMDMITYLNWANDPDVRNNAINSNPIPEENHRRWFESRLNSETTLMFVGMWQNNEVGQIRFDLIEGCWEISYSVVKDHQNKGFGELLIRKGMATLKELHTEPITITGVVKPDNISSLRVFRKLYFDEGSTLVERNGIQLVFFSYRLGI